MKSTPDRPLSPFAAPDALRAWVQRERARFDTLEPPADLWEAITPQLQPAPDALRAWTQQHQTAFDTLEPRADQWAAIEQALYPAAAPVPQMTASRGAAQSTQSTQSTQSIQTTPRPVWWQIAAAAAVVFGLGYGLRAGTEMAPVPVVVAAVDDRGDTAFGADEGDLHVAAPRHGFRNQEPDPAVQAALLASNVQPAEASAEETDQPSGLVAASSARVNLRAALAPEIARLEARYAALIARQRAAAQHRFVPTHTLGDEWDREMTVLDSAYAALRQELPRNPRTDEVVGAMNRNLHLRLKLLQQQMMALDAVQEMRQRAGQVVPRRPPSVNPDDNGVNLEDAVPGAGTRIPPAPPAPAPVPGLGARVAARPHLAA